MHDGMPAGFAECAQCKSWHLPVTGVCGWKLAQDAAFVLDACGSRLSLDLIAWVLRELGVKDGYHYVSAPEQRQAYLLTGQALSRTLDHCVRAGDGAEWVTKEDYPPDALLIATPEKYGMIKNLAVPQ